nr:hypothetical protein OH837_48965 [Streptomyces canus]
MTLAYVLAAIACLLSMTALYLMADGRMSWTTACALWMLAGLVTTIAFAVVRVPVFVAAGAAMTGWYALEWRSSGGGDGTRRRLRSFGRRFRAARRTAPSHT